MLTNKSALVTGSLRGIGFAAPERSRTGITCNAIRPSTLLTPTIDGRVDGGPVARRRSPGVDFITIQLEGTNTREHS